MAALLAGADVLGLAAATAGRTGAVVAGLTVGTAAAPLAAEGLGFEDGTAAALGWTAAAPLAAEGLAFEDGTALAFDGAANAALAALGFAADAGAATAAAAAAGLVWAGFLIVTAFACGAEAAAAEFTFVLSTATPGGPRTAPFLSLGAAGAVDVAVATTILGAPTSNGLPAELLRLRRMATVITMTTTMMTPTADATTTCHTGNEPAQSVQSDP